MNFDQTEPAAGNRLTAGFLFSAVLTVQPSFKNSWIQENKKNEYKTNTARNDGV
jgi:hypothetical protein